MTSIILFRFLVTILETSNNFSKLYFGFKFFTKLSNPPILLSPKNICGTELILFEPYTSNLYLRSTLAGEYIIINKNLILKLDELGLWNEEMKEEIMYFNGSIQNIHGIPDKIKEVFMTAYDMPQKNIVQQAVERGPFVDQSQSMNIFNNQPDFGKLASSHFYGWKNGLKTGMYYLRSQPAVDAIKFGLDPLSVKRIKNKYNRTNNDLIEIDSDSESPNNSLIVKKHTRTYEVCDVCSG